MPPQGLFWDVWGGQGIVRGQSQKSKDNHMDGGAQFLLEAGECFLKCAAFQTL